MIILLSSDINIILVSIRVLKERDIKAIILSR
jgi:hypothetical protein